MGFAEISEVVMISEDRDLMSGAKEVVSQVSECLHYSKQFVVVDVVISFSGR